MPREDLLSGLLQIRHIPKIKQCDVIDKMCVRAKGRFSKKNHLGLVRSEKNCKKRDADDDKRSTS